MPERIGPQAADVFSRLDSQREKRAIPSRFAETRDELLKREEEKLDREGKFVRYGVPIRSRLNTPQPSTSSLPTTPDTAPKRAPKTPHPSGLTEKELEVINMILKGVSRKRISETLDITTIAVTMRIREAKLKLGIPTSSIKLDLINQLREAMEKKS